MQTSQLEALPPELADDVAFSEQATLLLTPHALALRAIAKRAFACDAREYEDATDAQVRGELSPRCQDLVDNATAVLSALVEACSRLLDRSSDELRPVSAVTAASPLGSTPRVTLESLEQVAFVAHLELLPQRAGLQQAYLDRDQVLVKVDAALRRVRRGLCATERTLATLLQQSPVLGTEDSELERSLKTRRVYARLVRSMRRPPPVSIEDVRITLRVVGTRIAMLRGHEIYAAMRLKDRLMLRDFQRRILHWLSDLSDEFRLGVELWSDFQAATEMLLLVSHRVELQLHDAAVLKTLEALDPAATVDEIKATASVLEGLELEVDEVLAKATTPEAARRAIGLYGIHPPERTA